MFLWKTSSFKSLYAVATAFITSAKIKNFISLLKIFSSRSERKGITWLSLNNAFKFKRNQREKLSCKNLQNPSDSSFWNWQDDQAIYRSTRTSWWSTFFLFQLATTWLKKEMTKHLHPFSLHSLMHCCTKYILLERGAFLALASSYRDYSLKMTFEN